MKFITEEDLRDLYKREPFTHYDIEPGTRITPGARQFLADRGINMFDDIPKTAGNASKGGKYSAPDERIKNLCAARLRSRLRYMEALFLETAEELLPRDVLISQRLIGLGRNICGVGNALTGGDPATETECQSCTGINESNCCENMEDCFAITEFHIQLEKGKEIAAMHRLRCALREIELDALEYFAGHGAGSDKCDETVGKINKVINTLSQMICLAVGGEKCQKKS